MQQKDKERLSSRYFLLYKDVSNRGRYVLTLILNPSGNNKLNDEEGCGAAAVRGTERQQQPTLEPQMRKLHPSA